LDADPEWQRASAKGDLQECARIAEDRILILDLEQSVPSTTYSIIGTSTARATWMSSFQQMKAKWSSNKSSPRYVFLLAHLSFQSYSHFHTPVAWSHTDHNEHG
jgi:hypothetical protein